MRNLRDALKIDGWMWPRELEALRSIALSMPAGADVYEIGSWKGRSTVALAVDHINLTCVDTFKGSPNEITRVLAATGTVFDIFTRNMERLGLSPRVMRMDCLEAARSVPDGSADGVFQDGDHGPAFYWHFHDWYYKLKPGGVYFGHDYDPIEFPHIPRVLMRSGLHFTVLPGTRIWAMRKG